MEHCKSAEAFQRVDETVVRNQRKILIVVIISLVTMVVEIIAGRVTGSMSLLADGWHMGSHVAALSLSYLIYRLSRSPRFNSHFTFGSSKLFSLGGFTSSIGLSIIAFFMAYESILRFFNPVSIEFNEALLVCLIGLGVNVLCAFILKNEHHDHSHDQPHDHNHQSALVHVIADALTSVTAIFALLIGKYFQVLWMDPFIGLLGSAVILKWSYSLIKNTSLELLDAKSTTTDTVLLRNTLEAEGGKVVDLHIWSVGADNIAVIASLETKELRGAQFYHQKLEAEFDFAHLVVEEIKKS